MGRPRHPLTLLSGTIELMVSSSTLMGSSRVFTALLGPNFREGQGINITTQPKEISLPHDDPETMSDMCYLLHGTHIDKFLKAVDTPRVLRFAITVDKYGCTEALYDRMCTQWILLANLDAFNSTDMITNGQQMCAAYLLDNPRAFYLSTEHLVSEFAKPYQELLREEWSCHFPASILCK